MPQSHLGRVPLGQRVVTDLPMLHSGSVAWVRRETRRPSNGTREIRPRATVGESPLRAVAGRRPSRLVEQVFSEEKGVMASHYRAY